MYLYVYSARYKVKIGNDWGCLSRNTFLYEDLKASSYNLHMNESPRHTRSIYILSLACMRLFLLPLNLGE